MYTRELHSQLVMKVVDKAHLCMRHRSRDEHRETLEGCYDDVVKCIEETNGEWLTAMQSAIIGHKYRVYENSTHYPFSAVEKGGLWALFWLKFSHKNQWYAPDCHVIARKACSEKVTGHPFNMLEYHFMGLIDSIDIKDPAEVALQDESIKKYINDSSMAKPTKHAENSLIELASMSSDPRGAVMSIVSVLEGIDSKRIDHDHVARLIRGFYKQASRFSSKDIDRLAELAIVKRVH